MDFEQEIKQVLVKYVGEKEISLAKPKHISLGDYTFPCFTLGKNPHEEAQKLQEKLELPSLIAKVEVVGPYLNFFLNKHIVNKNMEKVSLQWIIHIQISQNHFLLDIYDQQ
jgi:arginyl-tRNA synthetase